MGNTRRGRHDIVFRESRRRSRNNRAGKMNRRQARSLSQRFDRLEECIRENGRRDFIRQLAMGSASVVASVAGAHWLSQQSENAGNRPEGRDVRIQAGSHHAVSAGGINVHFTATVVATSYVSAEVVVA